MATFFLSDFSLSSVRSVTTVQTFRSVFSGQGLAWADIDLDTERAVKQHRSEAARLASQDRDREKTVEGVSAMGRRGKEVFDDLLRSSIELARNKPRFLVRSFEKGGEKAQFGRDCLVNIIAAGDILIHDTTRKFAAQSDGSFDFKSNFKYVQPILSQGDLVIGNLENPLAGVERRLSGYPNFNAPQELATDLKQSGFSTVLIANNHSMDRSWSGLETTISTVEAANLDYVGAYKDPEDKKRRLISVYNGIKIAILAYTYGLNGYPGPKVGEEWRLGLIDRALIFSDLKSVREEGVDFVIISLHFGNEYERKPNKEQIKLVQELLKGDPENGLAGPELILGHHPHVVQPFVQIDNGANSSGQAVMYSLGNFMTSQPYPYTNLGVILEGQLRLTSDGQKFVGPFTLIPTLCYKGLRDGQGFYQVIPMAQAVNDPAKFGLTSTEGVTIAKALDEMNKHLVSMEPDPEKWPSLK